MLIVSLDSDTVHFLKLEFLLEDMIILNAFLSMQRERSQLVRNMKRNSSKKDVSYTNAVIMARRLFMLDGFKKSEVAAKLSDRLGTHACPHRCVHINLPSFFSHSSLVTSHLSPLYTYHSPRSSFPVLNVSPT